MAKESLAKTQAQMRKRYDKDVRDRVFNPGDKVLVLLPVHGEPLRASYSGSYRILKKTSNVNYITETPDRRKASRICHVNILKPYHERNDFDWCNLPIVEANSEKKRYLINYGLLSKNSEILRNLNTKLGYLEPSQRIEMENLLSSSSSIFSDTSGKTNILQHDVDVRDARPIMQHT
ncbi:hypothetical protein HOLleu_42313 [Holothuria leucospilota]|uniref:Integrase p58-like C-terminal domain-containing protein n=1 Tax=Holothuria leucospilota TaxID=206669 RepID=A0A9Q1BBE3_HOLLE|nr:hypothetical protein HOLleu_42313 [Holothuria leucospilota]